MLNHLINFLKIEGDLSFWKNVIVIASISGLANAGLLALINIGAELATNEGLNFRIFAMYVVVFLIFFITKKYSLFRASQEIERIIINVRERISDKVRQSELKAMESVDNSVIFTRLTQDTNIISQVGIILTNSAQALMMMTFALIYILIISQLAFFVILGSVVVTVFLYRTFARDINIDLIEINSIEEKFFASLNGIISGFKELKVNTKKSDHLFREHKTIIDSLGTLKMQTSKKFVTNMMFTETFLYTLLGVIVFVLPHLVSEQSETIIKVTAATLFIIGPLDMTVSVLPTISRANISAKTLRDLEDLLDTEHDAPDIKKNSEIIESFDKIKLHDVEFHYLDKSGSRVFSIGPINLDINRGEVIFIVGGNGSGKSTLVKALLGLYFPQNGYISIDDEIVDDYNYQSYRELFSIILGDFHLFKKLYGLGDVNAKIIKKLLIDMQLDKKTKFIDGEFTDIDLSTGQRKRLALIASILEDKPIYVFDEWAADQDPEFRKHFYYEIIKDLKSQGKTIIAVTHDDAYFDVADKIYKMEYGKIISFKDAS